MFLFLLQYYFLPRFDKLSEIFPPWMSLVYLIVLIQIVFAGGNGAVRGVPLGEIARLLDWWKSGLGLLDFGDLEAEVSVGIHGCVV